MLQAEPEVSEHFSDLTAVLAHHMVFFGLLKFALGAKNTKKQTIPSLRGSLCYTAVSTQAIKLIY